MSSPAKTVYLVSGANRGIGFGLVSTLLQRSDVKIYAGARDPSKATALNELASKSNGKLQVLKLSSTSVEDGQAAAETIKKTDGRLDVVIANAGIANFFGSLADTPIKELDDHFEVNVKGVLILYQATHALLAQSKQPKFVLISTIAASLGGPVPWPVGAYGASKAATNFLMVRIHDEHPEWVSLALHPGMVQSDMGNAAAKNFGLEQAPVTIEDSVNGMLKLVDTSNREEKAKFIGYDGAEIPW